MAAYPGRDPERFVVNPAPPVEFGAPGIDLEVAWADGGRIVATGNSFAAPHIAGLVARIVGAHPGITPGGGEDRARALADNAATLPTGSVLQGWHGPPCVPPRRSPPPRQVGGVSVTLAAALDVAVASGIAAAALRLTGVGGGAA